MHVFLENGTASRRAKWYCLREIDPHLWVHPDEER
jgi:hypothetical protein